MTKRRQQGREGRRESQRECAGEKDRVRERLCKGGKRERESGGGRLAKTSERERERERERGERERER